MEVSRGKSELRFRESVLEGVVFFEMMRFRVGEGDALECFPSGRRAPLSASPGQPNSPEAPGKFSGSFSGLSLKISPVANSPCLLFLSNFTFLSPIPISQVCVRLFCLLAVSAFPACFSHSAVFHSMSFEMRLEMQLAQWFQVRASNYHFFHNEPTLPFISSTCCFASYLLILVAASPPRFFHPQKRNRNHNLPTAPSLLLPKPTSH